MDASTTSCKNGTTCPSHFHADDPMFLDASARSQLPPTASERQTAHSETYTSSTATDLPKQMGDTQTISTDTENSGYDPDDHGFRRIVRNFTPSWFIITMSTGVVSILLHQMPDPYAAHWLEIISIIFFILNLVLFLLFTFISCLRYTLYPEIIPAVLRHPHQSLFVACFPVGLATLINMTVLVCVPAWGKGMATLAWALWWIDSVLALMTCFHLTFNIMSHHRSELAEMTALYLIPIVAVVIVATTGGLVASVISDPEHQFWTLIISYIFWGLGSCLSWIVLTLYFLRMTTHNPLKREVIVSLLLPVGALGLSGFSIITLGKVAKHLFPIVHSLPNVTNTPPGDIFYIVGVMAGLIFWGFDIVWFVVAALMIALAGGFPFNMGWWGFIFPIGVFTLLTMALGEELESRFMKILSVIMTTLLVITWLIIAAKTIQNSITGKMFFAPCLGTDLYSRRLKAEKIGLAGRNGVRGGKAVKSGDGGNGGQGVKDVKGEV